MTTSSWRHADNVTATMNVTGGGSGLDTVAAERFIYFAEAVIQPTILGFGMLTNVVSLIVLRRVNLTESFRICLLALSLSDLCATITGFTQLIHEVVQFGGNMPFGFWSVGAAANYALYFTYLMFMCTSGSLVILIAVIRNLIVLRPLRARNYFTRRRTLGICLGVFLVTFTLYLPTALEVIWQSCFKETVAPPCERVNATIGIPTLKRFVHKYVYFLKILYGPVLFLTYIACIICIWVTLRRSSKELVAMTTRRKDARKDSIAQRDKATSRVTRTLLLILIFDILCTLPTIAYGINLLYNPQKHIFDDSQISFEIFDVVAEICFCCRPAYNFWLYFFHNKEFQKRFKELLSCRGVRRSDMDSSMRRSDDSGTARTDTSVVFSTGTVRRYDATEPPRDVTSKKQMTHVL